ncbi:MAG: CPBP family intramembrane glutamic endopeptidase [Ktedonobacteraceae bacterium]
MLNLQVSKVPTIKPMPFWVALIYFGASALLFRICVYAGFPLLLSAGIPQFPTLLISYITPLAILLIASLVMYRQEGNQLTWSAFKERFRLRPMNGKAWLWTAGGFVVGYLGSGALLFTSRWLATIPLFAPPAFLPAYLTPKVVPSLVYTEFLGVSLKGNWWFAIAYLVLLTFNIFGEEFWWRGYILPRQELAHGKWTWLIHGTLWTLFHVPIYPWNLFSLLPTCLALSFVAQRLRNTWPGIVIHYISNGLVMIPIVLGIAGMRG